MMPRMKVMLPRICIALYKLHTEDMFKLLKSETKSGAAKEIIILLEAPVPRLDI